MNAKEGKKKNSLDNTYRTFLTGCEDFAFVLLVCCLATRPNRFELLVVVRGLPGIVVVVVVVVVLFPAGLIIAEAE